MNNIYEGTTTAKSYDYTIGGQRGWICPVCGRGVNPNLMYCSCGGFNKFEITCNDTFDESLKRMTDFAKQTNYNGDKK